MFLDLFAGANCVLLDMFEQATKHAGHQIVLQQTV